MKVGLDIDGVLADFAGHFKSYLNIEGEEFKIWDDIRIVENFHKIEQDIWFWGSMPPLISNYEIKFKPDVYITSRPIPSRVTEGWLAAHKFPKAPVITAFDKLPIVNEYDLDIFVDDHIENYEQLREAGRDCKLMTTPQNTWYEAEHRVKTLFEVGKLIN